MFNGQIEPLLTYIFNRVKVDNEFIQIESCMENNFIGLVGALMNYEMAWYELWERNKEVWVFTISNPKPPNSMRQGHWFYKYFKILKSHCLNLTDCHLLSSIYKVKIKLELSIVPF